MRHSEKDAEDLIGEEENRVSWHLRHIRKVGNNLRKPHVCLLKTAHTKSHSSRQFPDCDPEKEALLGSGLDPRSGVEMSDIQHLRQPKAHLVGKSWTDALAKGSPPLALKQGRRRLREARPPAGPDPC